MMNWMMPTRMGTTPNPWLRDIWQGLCSPGDCYLLATDGLHDSLPAAQLQDLWRSDRTAQVNLDALHTAYRQGRAGRRFCGGTVHRLTAIRGRNGHSITKRLPYQPANKAHRLDAIPWWASHPDPARQANAERLHRELQ